MIFLDSTTSITSELPNICNLITDKLCDHICVPVNGSYRCQCRPGFTLLADSKSCYKEVGNRYVYALDNSYIESDIIHLTKSVDH